MTNSAAKNLTSIERISSILLATLNEGVFFAQLSSHLATVVNAESVRVFRTQEDGAPKLVASNFQAVSEESEEDSRFAAYVQKNKRPYFSNNVERDPVLASEAARGVKSLLCIPVAHDGVIMATIHFEMASEVGNFSRQNITDLMEVLAQLKSPIANMKMYLSAMSLNQALMKQISEQKVAPAMLKVVAADLQIEEKEIVLRSESMKKLINLADKAAQTSVNILIEGEFGTGKEMIARRIHCRSARAAAAYKVVDCAQAEESLLAEIFGRDSVQGALEIANSGTVLLKNIEKMTMTAQARLAQFIKDGVAIRMNSVSPFRSSVRFVATSNISLLEKIENGTFSDALYYALNTIELAIPALRSRSEDIEVLANHFLNRNKANDQMKSIAPSALRVLCEYSWKNNVRELQSMMERAYILAEGMIVDETHLPEQVMIKQVVEAEVEETENYKFVEMTLTDLEKHHICKTLDFLGGNKTKTAKVLGITVKTLYNKLHSYGMIDLKEEA